MSASILPQLVRRNCNVLKAKKKYLDITNNEAMTALRNFILSFDKTGLKEKKFLCSLSSMEDTFLRMTIKREKQSSLKEFFKVMIRNAIVQC